MAEKRRGLGRGLGALIPSGPSGADRPVDVFFPGSAAAVALDENAPPEVPHQGSEPDLAGLGRPRGALLRDGAETATEASARDGIVAREDAPGGMQETAGDEVAAAEDAAVDATASASSDTSTPAGTPMPAVQDTTPPAADPTVVTAPQEDERTDAPDDGTSLVPVPGVHFAEVPVEAIRPNPRQPRTVFDEDALAELVGSIREIGVLQPVVVRPVPGEDGAQYELIMGERRWRATQKAGLPTIPAIVRETEDHDLLRDALLENLHRSQLNALEEAAAYQQLLDDFGCTHEELATRIHRSRPQISNTLRLLRLPPLVQRRVAAGVLSAGHARALLGLPDAAAMERLAQRIVAEGLSVRATEEIVTLGGDPERRAPVRRPRAGGRNLALDDLASRLSDRFDTRVKIALGKNKGRLTVEFASVDDLNRILATLSPDDPGLLR
ncbi:ParB/RepB/Spo0J family partition protein [Actinotalea sp. Marseille-Q4924]|uniref:ParB/RepB/Spo0J family partition protein n=1 Tax=Actinotalea sp. Marseille-Q4924 TaxID=2866571 RepID=UPI001CE47460|nr:ParB/RepB/Spo0J family partition protein [Actinotalea sp. Marseille-Q4924]